MVRHGGLCARSSRTTSSRFWARRKAFRAVRAGAAVRNRALATLTRQGFAAAAQVLDAREKTKDPELRRLLDRWLIALYERKLR